MDVRLFLAITITVFNLSQTLLYGDPQPDHSPVWSPDGSRIAFLRDEGAGATFFRINTNDGNVVDRTNGIKGVHHVWSPDGNQIAYVAFGIDTWSLHVMQADGSQGGQILQRSFSPYDLIWSPDGSKLLAWDGDDLFTIHPDGTQYTSLASDGAIGSLYTWSPDSRLLAFSPQRSSSTVSTW